MFSKSKKIFFFSRYFGVIVILSNFLILEKIFAQDFYPGVFELSASKTSISYGETVSLTFTVKSGWGSNTKFYVSIPVSDRGAYEVIGIEHWSGILKPGELKTLSFEK